MKKRNCTVNEVTAQLVSVFVFPYVETGVGMTCV